jgi:Na+/proline symporter
MTEASEPAPVAAAASDRPIGRQRGVGFVIVLYIVTLGIYGLYWIYKSFDEMKGYRRQGVSGIVGLLLAFIIVSTFLLPAYVGRMYNEDGNPNNPVSGLTGFWVFVPYVGTFIWLYKIQTALNQFWASKGAPPPGA